MRVGLIEVGRAFVDEVRVAGLVAAGVGVGLGVIGIEGVIVDEVAEVDADGACEVRLAVEAFLV